MRLLLLFGLLILPISGAWQRRVMTPKQFWVDAQNAQTLAYFTTDPGLRCEDCDFGWDWPPEKRLTESHKIKTDLISIGTLAGFTIYDLYHRFSGYYLPNHSSDTKLILVKTGADQYREIYQCTPTTGAAVPSVVVEIGKNRFLEAKHSSGGKAADLYDYFWFDENGATLVDFRPVLRAAQSVFPKGDTPWMRDALSDRGVEFKFDHNRVVATRAFYRANASVR